MLRPPIDNAVITWLDATREGVHKSPLPTDPRELTITAEHIDQLVAFVAARTTPIPIDGANLSGVHELGGNSAAPAAGWVIGAAKVKQSNGVHLWLAVALLPEVAAQIGGQVLLYGSPILAGGPAGVGDKPAALHSYALTNLPFVQGLEPHRLGRTKPGEGVEGVEVLAVVAVNNVALIAAAIEQQTRNTTMDKKTLEALRAMLGDAAKDKTDEQIMALAKEKLGAAAPPAPEPKPEPEKPKVDPKPDPKPADPPAPTAEAAAVKELREKFEALERDKKKSDLTAYLATKVGELGLVVEEKDRDEYVELALGRKGKETIDSLLKLRPQPPKGRVLDKGGQTRSGGQTFPTDEAAVEHFEASIREKDKTLSDYEVKRQAILAAASAKQDFGGAPMADALERGAREAR